MKYLTLIFALLMAAGIMTLFMTLLMTPGEAATVDLANVGIFLLVGGFAGASFTSGRMDKNNNSKK